VNSSQFKDWVDLVDPMVSYLGVESGDPIGHKRFLSLFAGGMLPLISLSFLHMLVKFEEEEKKNISTEPQPISTEPQPIINIDELSIAAGKKEAEIEETKYTPTQEDLDKLEEELRKVNELKFGILVEDSNSVDPEIKRLSYTKRDA
jgi:hypothetical protein